MTDAPNASTGADPLTDLAAAEAFAKDHKHRNRYGHANREFVLGAAPGTYQCQGETHDRESRFHGRNQCTKAGKIATADGLHWCGLHSPQGVEKRKAAQAERYRQNGLAFDARMKRDREERAKRAAFEPFRAALQAIAVGDNDPRTTAREALGDYFTTPEEPEDAI